MITEEEWELIRREAIDDIEKSLEKMDKNIASFKNSYLKLEEKTSKVIQDKEKRESGLQAIRKLKEMIAGNIVAYRKYMGDKNSAGYNFKTGKEEIAKIHEMGNKWRTEIVDCYIETYFAMVNATTPEEWNKIVRSMKKLY
jgi:translation elongation factor EF-G